MGQEKTGWVKRSVAGSRERWLGQETLGWLGQEKGDWVKKRVAGQREDWLGKEKGGAAHMAEWVRSLYFSALNHSIISLLCLAHWPYVRQDKFCLRVCQVVFPGYSCFVPPIDWLVSMSEIILKGTLN